MNGHKAIQRFSKGCTNREVKKVVLSALRNGARFRMTKAGLTFYGEEGQTVGVHLTVSDHRAVKNLRSSLARVGITA